jgi:hypothetical protein
MTSRFSNGKQIRSMPKYFSKINRGQFKQTEVVVTEPLAGATIIISPFIEDTTRLSLFTQSATIKE